MKAKRRGARAPAIRPGSGRRLELMPLAELTGAEKNPKRHDDAGIGASIGRFGYVEPVVLDERTKRIVAGHGRTQSLKVAKAKGEAPPEGVTVGPGGVWLIPVLRGWASRSDTEAEAYLLASNQLTLAGGWDDPELAEMLKSLEAQGALDGTGFDEEAIEQVLKDAAAALEPVEGQSDPDEVPEVESVAVRPGDVYQLGAHRLICGDSTRAEDVDRVLEGAQVDVVWTDPPYGVDYESKAGKVHNDGAEGLGALLQAAFAQCVRVLKPGGFIYVAHPAGTNSLVFYDAVRAAGLSFRQGLTWVKDALVLGHADYHYRHEPIIYAMKPAEAGRRGRGGLGWYGDNAQTSVFEVPKPKRSDEHPTMKPVELIEAMLRNSTAPGHVVFEPFSGSGSTLIACERLGLQCSAVELSPLYVARTIARWEAFTGRQAERVT